MNKALDYDTDMAEKFKSIAREHWPISNKYLEQDNLIEEVLRYAGYDKIADAFESTEKCYD